MRRLSLRTATIIALLFVLVVGLIWGSALPWHLSLELSARSALRAGAPPNWQLEGSAFSVALLLLLGSWLALWLMRLLWRIFVAPVFLAGWFRSARQRRRATRRLEALEETARLALAGDYDRARTAAQTASDLATPAPASAHPARPPSSLRVAPDKPAPSKS